MIKINNVEMPSPIGYTAMMMDITNAERDAKGTMHIDFIARKWKLEIGWGVLDQPQMSELLKALESSVTFNVSFIDPITGESNTAVFYKGDRSIPMLGRFGGVLTWKDFKINLIEV